VLLVLQVNAEGVFRYAGIPWFSQALQLLTASGVHGVAVDVWVGVPLMHIIQPLCTHHNCSCCVNSMSVSPFLASRTVACSLLQLQDIA
jgi:hypothetical protein